MQPFYGPCCWYTQTIRICPATRLASAIMWSNSELICQLNKTRTTRYWYFFYITVIILNRKCRIELLVINVSASRDFERIENKGLISVIGTGSLIEFIAWLFVGMLDCVTGTMFWKSGMENKKKQEWYTSIDHWTSRYKLFCCFNSLRPSDAYMRR